MLGLKPWELGALQPLAIYAMIDGYNHRRKVQDERDAYWMSLLLNTSGKSYKRRIKAADLLQPLYSAKKQAAEPKRTKEYYNELLKRNK